MVALTTCYLALMPDDAFATTVLHYKQRVERRVGTQLYLDDPPHLTLYLADFPHLPAVVSAARIAAQNLRMPTAKLRGWHVFHDDPLNGNHTLVCDIDPQDRDELAKCQALVCGEVSSLRDVEATQARYASTWPQLAESARACILQWGFPFIGSIWHPHVTIASIRPADWDSAWSELKNDPPAGTIHFHELCLFALDDGRSVLLERFRLESERECAS